MISTYKESEWKVYKVDKIGVLRVASFKNIPKQTTTKIGTLPHDRFKPAFYFRNIQFSITRKLYQIMINVNATRDINCYNYESSDLSGADTIDQFIVYPTN